MIVRSLPLTSSHNMGSGKVQTYNTKYPTLLALGHSPGESLAGKSLRLFWIWEDWMLGGWGGGGRVYVQYVPIVYCSYEVDPPRCQSGVFLFWLSTPIYTQKVRDIRHIILRSVK